MDVAAKVLAVNEVACTVGGEHGVVTVIAEELELAPQALFDLT